MPRRFAEILDVCVVLALIRLSRDQFLILLSTCTTMSLSEYDLPPELIARGLILHRNDPIPLTPRSQLALYQKGYVQKVVFADRVSFERIRESVSLRVKRGKAFPVLARGKSDQRVEGLGTILTATRQCRANFTVVHIRRT